MSFFPYFCYAYSGCDSSPPLCLFLPDPAKWAPFNDCPLPAGKPPSLRLLTHLPRDFMPLLLLLPLPCVCLCLGPYEGSAVITPPLLCLTCALMTQDFSVGLIVRKDISSQSLFVFSLVGLVLRFSGVTQLFSFPLADKRDYLRSLSPFPSPTVFFGDAVFPAPFLAFLARRSWPVLSCDSSVSTSHFSPQGVEVDVTFSPSPPNTPWDAPQFLVRGFSFPILIGPLSRFRRRFSFRPDFPSNSCISSFTNISPVQ